MGTVSFGGLYGNTGLEFAFSVYDLYYSSTDPVNTFEVHQNNCSDGEGNRDTWVDNVGDPLNGYANPTFNITIQGTNNPGVIEVGIY
jgi:hypothetical protein